MIPVERSGRCVRFRTRTLRNSNRHFQAYALAIYDFIAHTCFLEHDICCTSSSHPGLYLQVMATKTGFVGIQALAST